MSDTRDPTPWTPREIVANFRAVDDAGDFAIPADQAADLLESLFAERFTAGELKGTREMGERMQQVLARATP